MKKLLSMLTVGAILLLPGCVCEEMCEVNAHKSSSHGLHKRQNSQKSVASVKKAAPKKMKMKKKKVASKKKKVAPKKMKIKKKKAAPKKIKSGKKKGKKHAYSDDFLERAPWTDTKKELVDLT